MPEAVQLSPAEEASENALAELRQAIDEAQCFKLEAGAGAGKTYSLVEALKYLVKQKGRQLSRKGQKIACITYTNVARDEIETRTDRSPVIYCDTIHAFCWSLISGFQNQLRNLLPELEKWKERLEEVDGPGKREIEYILGYRSTTDDAISLHHDDVLALTVKLLDNEKFAHLLMAQYPIVLIDEYQDTNAEWVDAIKRVYLSKDARPLFGFFGDHWQKIYGDGCGELDAPSVRSIQKKANFRSVKPIVDCLNRMRSELPQFVVDPEAPGEVILFHTNDWTGERRDGPHYGGDLLDEKANEVFKATRERLEGGGWDFSPDRTKVLMLTHRALGRYQGYASLPAIFGDNNAFTKKEQPHIAFFADHLEPACRAFTAKRYGEMFAALGANKRHLDSGAEKRPWAESMQALISLRESATVGDLIAHLQSVKLPPLSDAAERLERRLEEFDADDGQEMSRSLSELMKLHEVPYTEIVAVTAYLDGHSPFETKHGVKGAEFENVFVVIGRGWNKYNFNKMLEMAGGKPPAKEKEQEFFERNRNLFYVVCSRPKRRLALLFTQELSAGALNTLSNWFGDKNIVSAF